jgi:hypothetical protein
MYIEKCEEKAVRKCAKKIKNPHGFFILFLVKKIIMNVIIFIIMTFFV